MSPIISVIITAIIVAPITWIVAVAYRKNSYESKIGSAEEKSREIIDEALKVAETKKKEALLEAKEENLKAKNELEKETRERRAEIQRYERRVLSKEENLDKKRLYNLGTGGLRPGGRPDRPRAGDNLCAP